MLIVVVYFSKIDTDFRQLAFELRSELVCGKRTLSGSCHLDGSPIVVLCVESGNKRAVPTVFYSVSKQRCEESSMALSG